MILCADDYGLREDINRAVLELCEKGRLSGVSCMVLFEQCSAEVLARLLAFQERIDVGLHLCLTHEEPRLCAALTGAGSAELPAYGSLLRRALSGRVQPGEVARQLAAQYELFIKKCGRAPDYIDGHLHVHQLPGVQAGARSGQGFCSQALRVCMRPDIVGDDVRSLSIAWRIAGLMTPYVVSYTLDAYALSQAFTLNKLLSGRAGFGHAPESE